MYCLIFIKLHVNTSTLGTHIAFMNKMILIIQIMLCFQYWIKEKLFYWVGTCIWLQLALLDKCSYQRLLGKHIVLIILAKSYIFAHILIFLDFTLYYFMFVVCYNFVTCFVMWYVVIIQYLLYICALYYSGLLSAISDILIHFLNILNKGLYSNVYCYSFSILFPLLISVY